MVLRDLLKGFASGSAAFAPIPTAVLAPAAEDAAGRVTFGVSLLVHVLFALGILSAPGAPLSIEDERTLPAARVDTFAYEIEVLSMELISEEVAVEGEEGPESTGSGITSAENTQNAGVVPALTREGEGGTEANAVLVQPVQEEVQRREEPASTTPEPPARSQLSERLEVQPSVVEHEEAPSVELAELESTPSEVEPAEAPRSSTENRSSAPTAPVAWTAPARAPTTEQSQTADEAATQGLSEAESFTAERGDAVQASGEGARGEQGSTLGPSEEGGGEQGNTNEVGPRTRQLELATGEGVSLLERSNTDIPYPREAWSNRWETTCIATLRVDRRGRVTHVEDVDCDAHASVFAPAFQRHVQRWFRFTPPRRDGQAVEALVRWRHDFELRQR